MSYERAKFDIAIVGAGTLGASLALQLAQHTDYSILVLERSAPLIEPRVSNERVFALGQHAVELLREVGVLHRLDPEVLHAYRSMRVWDGQSTGQLQFSAHDINQQQLGWMVDVNSLGYILQQSLLTQANVTIKFDAQLSSLSNTNTGIVIGGVQQRRGTQTKPVIDFECSAKLAVAADGVHSWLRQRAGLFANRMSYQQQGIVARISTSQAHQDCAWQRFLSTGPVAVLPLANGQSSIVWSADSDYCSALMQLEQSEFETALAAALEHQLGRIKLMSGRVHFPLISQTADRYYNKRVVLVGDAAHSIHPLAGQGANLGFKDVTCLASLLTPKVADEAPAARRRNSSDLFKQRGLHRESQPLDTLRFLPRYQRLRQKDNQQTDWLMTALQRSFSVSNPSWSSLRGFGMNLLNQNHRLRALLAQQAMGI